jgi:hypothetical protein
VPSALDPSEFRTRPERRVGRVLQRFKMAKHFGLELGEATFHYERDAVRIAAEAGTDGI